MQGNEQARFFSINQLLLIFRNYSSQGNLYFEGTEVAIFYLRVQEKLARNNLTLKPFLGSLKTPEDKNPSYYVFMVLKLVRTLGSLKTPKTVNVSIFGNGSKVNKAYCKS